VSNHSTFLFNIMRIIYYLISFIILRKMKEFIQKLNINGYISFKENNRLFIFILSLIRYYT
jgi:hypothetical protein